VDGLASRFGARLLAHPEAGVEGSEPLVDGDVVRSGGLTISAIGTPGHAPGHLALLADGSDCLTGDVLFRGTVGGTRGGGPTGFDDLRRSVFALLALPPETALHPGHREPTTVADEWDGNPFVRVWRGLDGEGSDRCRVGGEEMTLVLWVWAPDYDGGHKAWVRTDDGRDAIVGGSQVERL
jgi:glyoxylase-like metal-dependent hydrolase (beta-lactamase superfamily II)